MVRAAKYAISVNFYNELLEYGENVEAIMSRENKQKLINSNQSIDIRFCYLLRSNYKSDDEVFVFTKYSMKGRKRKVVAYITPTLADCKSYC